MSDQILSGAEGYADDELTLELLDRALHRAIEYQVDEDLGMRPLDLTTLQRVAAEIGVDPGHLRRALAEVASEDFADEMSLMDRLLAPDRLLASAVVSGSRNDVEGRVYDWMRQHEGMRVRGRLPGGSRWEKDSHMLTSLRMGLRLGRSSATLRRLGDVTHRVRSVDPNEQIVSLEADSSKIRNVGIGLLAVGGAIGAAGAATAGIAGEPLGIISAVAATTLWWSAAIVGARSWAGRIRRALQRVVEGVADPSVVGSDESVAGQIDRVRRAWRGRRPR